MSFYDMKINQEIGSLTFIPSVIFSRKQKTNQDIFLSNPLSIQSARPEKVRKKKMPTTCTGRDVILFKIKQV